VGGEYPGYWPSVVSRDAKYHVTAAGDVELIYRESASEERSLNAPDHKPLVDMVNAVKVAHTGRPGGAFYLNEHGHIVVPVMSPSDRQIKCYFAGKYPGRLRFPYHGEWIGPEPPAGLLPGDDWPGPHVGISHILAAGGDDIRYETRIPNDPGLIRRVRLSEEVGPAYAAHLAGRLTNGKGWGGGRIYINEAQAFFAPVEIKGKYRFIYLGCLDGAPWFPEPRLGVAR
jgi:hypothetical protein